MSAPVHGTCRLSHGSRILWITKDGKTQCYIVERLPKGCKEDPVVKLITASGDCYEVHKESCTCGDAHFRGRFCKHRRALQVLGFFKESADDKATGS